MLPDSSDTPPNGISESGQGYEAGKSGGVVRFGRASLAKSRPGRVQPALGCAESFDQVDELAAKKSTPNLVNSSFLDLIIHNSACDRSPRAKSPAMSLTSRLSSFFSQESSVSEPQRNGYAEADFDLDGARQNKRLRTMENLEEEEVDIELKRPPYLHVRAGCSAAVVGEEVANTGHSQCLPEESGARLVIFSCIL